ncbi:TetR/AcrR family transcriptional regulator [Nocardioides sp. Root151]|uniref:TetR/AcrR family transcriptional regulator n=1 Tax=Nocardioides sp. Root151 TaxID=1736475 RepID=UPI0009EB3823|nr:TetR/AcrR family transcriptional regulator [Nocardioides sp. Root151]
MSTPAPTRRRQQTRQRLLDAALVVFAREGFGRSTVEQVCEQAGFTRGAFYSNFTSLDELFLAIWEQRSDEMQSDLAAFLTQEPPPVTSLREAVEHVLSAVPLDDEWYRVTAEFTAHALRNPALRRVMAQREERIEAGLMPTLEALLARVGRRVIDPAALGPALVAVHDGTSVQCLIEPDNAAVLQRRTDLFVLLVTAHTVEADTAVTDTPPKETP